MEQRQYRWIHGGILAFRFVATGYDSVCNNYKKTYNTPEKMGHLAFTDLKFRELDQNGSLVHCTGKWVVFSKTEGEHSGIFSLIFKNIKGQWKIIIDHTW
jgi:ketosteroid isomerase-like protein